MTTQTNTGTNPNPNTAGSARTRRLSKKQMCVKCGNLDTSDAVSMGDGVGWCRVARQYRVLRIERECESFRSMIMLPGED